MKLLLVTYNEDASINQIKDTLYFTGAYLYLFP